MRKNLILSLAIGISLGLTGCAPNRDVPAFVKLGTTYIISDTGLKLTVMSLQVEGSPGWVAIEGIYGAGVWNPTTGAVAFDDQ